ncbi:MAG: dienelactone hydrolase family protein [Blastocatellia bacterium]|nr:dienelactone hydrolase family protein [Blastocatellia bacterium]
MIITGSFVDLDVETSSMRTYVVRPNSSGRFPAVILYSEIFQLTGPIIRSCNRLAGHGFVVAAPEIYHRIEAPGTVIPYDDAGRIRGNEDISKTTAEEIDSDCRALIGYLKNHENVEPEKIASMGFCLGGHLSFRAALQPEIKAAISIYGTGLHSGLLGVDTEPRMDTLSRADDIRAKLFLVFGTRDPHVPEEGRTKIEQTLKDANVSHTIHLYDAEHAFMRDEGARYDPSATDSVWQKVTSFLHTAFDNKLDL